MRRCRGPVKKRVKLKVDLIDYMFVHSPLEFAGDPDLELLRLLGLVKSKISSHDGEVISNVDPLLHAALPIADDFLKDLQLHLKVQMFETAVAIELEQRISYDLFPSKAPIVTYADWEGIHGTVKIKRLIFILAEPIARVIRVIGIFGSHVECAVWINLWSCAGKPLSGCSQNCLVKLLLSDVGVG